MRADHQRLFMAAALCALLSAAPGRAAGKDFDPGILKNGDIIFQTSRSGQSQAIQAATHSPYSHCGLIFIHSGSIYVFEASTKVKRSPFKRFVGKGEGKKFVIKRSRNADSLLTPENLGKLAEAGKKFNGLPYDSYFGWSDEKIYCSELIYKIYRNALGIEIGKTAKLRDFDLTEPHVTAKLRERYGQNIPLDETVISPAAQFTDSNLVEVFNNY
ncbi:MAG: hypothetical protein JWO30_4338 [Fibrobacteres bacterium]|nr:hypothetical protein [Fibrobacterota bacterium]